MGATDTSTNIARLGYEFGVYSGRGTSLYFEKGEDFRDWTVKEGKGRNQISSDAKSGISGR